MLLIFDLDDTLVQTSSYLTIPRLESAFSLLVEKGLRVGNQEEAFALLIRLNQTAESAKSALLEFLEILGQKDPFAELGIQEIYKEMDDDSELEPLEGVRETLDLLQERHTLCIATMGVEREQRRKIEKAGIDSTLFSKILVSSDKNKKPLYKKILEETGFTPKETVVCGDRIQIDLLPAKELGFSTVHIRSGRGLYLPVKPQEKQSVDFVITEFKQMKEIVHL